VAQKFMSKNRFNYFLDFGTFQTIKIATEGDRIYKIRDIIDKIVNSFQNVLEPGELLAVDETMVHCCGRLFRQYMPGKVHKYGVNPSLVSVLAFR